MSHHRNNGLRKVCGCGRNKWAKCAHGWHLNFQWAGVPYRLSVDREVGEHVVPKADAKAGGRSDSRGDSRRDVSSSRAGGADAGRVDLRGVREALD